MIQVWILYGLLLLTSIGYWFETKHSDKLQMKVYELEYILELAQLHERLMREEEENNRA